MLDHPNTNASIQNLAGQEPLIVGYLMLWTMPSEAKKRAVSTLAQVIGAAGIAAARAKIDSELRKKFKPSRALVDAAADGDSEKMLGLLKEFADPNSAREGFSALASASRSGKLAAVQLLLDFKADVTVPTTSNDRPT